MSLKKLFITLLFIFLFSGVAHSAPSKPSLSGTYNDDGTITISGSSFGSGPSDVEFTKAAIEAGTNGAAFTPSGWSNEGGGWAIPVYSSTRSWSGAKSVYTPIRSSGSQIGPLYYDMGNIPEGGSVYVTWWVYATGDTPTQWKFFRFMNSTGQIQDVPASPAPQIQFFSWINVGSSLTRRQPDTSTSDSDYYFSTMFPGLGAWYRIELLLKPGSQGSSNGTLIGGRYTGSSGSYTSHSWNDGTANTMFYNTSGRFGSCTWHDYWGYSSEDADIYKDDMYISTGTSGWARVELCHGSSWGSRGVCEIQNPQSWSESSITAKLNVGGSFDTDDTAYLYVIDASNNASPASDPITIGSTGSDTTSPTVSGNPTIGTDGETITINFTESVVTTGYVDGSFDLDCSSSGSDIALNSISGSGSSREFTAAYTIYTGDTCNLDYTGGENEIEDASGNDLATFSNDTVANNSTQNVPTTASIQEDSTGTIGVTTAGSGTTTISE